MLIANYNMVQSYAVLAQFINSGFNGLTSCTDQVTEFMHYAKLSSLEPLFPEQSTRSWIYAQSQK